MSGTIEVGYEDRIPNARLGGETPISHQQAFLGSSQTETGCQGDFCNFALSYLENKDVTGGNSMSDENGTSFTQLHYYTHYTTPLLHTVHVCFFTCSHNLLRTPPVT
jgi:hypothetical protein